jgi:hypothetical protein
MVGIAGPDIVLQAPKIKRRNFSSQAWLFRQGPALSSESLPWT